MSFWNCFSCFQFNNNNNNSSNNIIKLDYCNCTLNDIPNDVLQNERTLEELLLSSNRISIIPSELFYCQHLKILKINDNELSVIPNSIGMLRNLQEIDFSRNVISSIPDNIKSCKKLTYLDLSLNNLQRLPDALTELITLKELYLNETYLEFLPTEIGRLINLKILELRSNNLITLPKSIGKLISLNRIDIGGNEFTELPDEIGNLIQLRELWIDYNRIRRINCNISNLHNLIHFEGNNNQLTSLPNEISNWKNLEILSMSSNNLEYLPFSIGMLKNLITLKCDGNQLKEIPDSICNLSNLEELIINNNYILRLPNTIGILYKLIFLAIDENLIRRLPNEICQCKELKIISARNNKLIELPNDIGNLKNLYVLNIINNLIINLPVTILNLTQLQALWLCDNQSQPLVPLQFLDDINKTQLTCFMLPQQKYHKKKLNNSDELLQKSLKIQSININDNDLINVQQRLTNINDNVTSPSRRICFADESTTIKINEQNQNDNQNSTTSTVITTGLMRSPTPYPKELRLMAKYVRNQQNYKIYEKNDVEIQDEQLQQQFNIDSFKSLTVQQSSFNTDIKQKIYNDLNIKEAKILINPNTVIHQDNQYKLSNDLLSTSTIQTNDNITNICDTIYDRYGNSILPNYINLQKPTTQNQILHNDKIDNYNNDIIYDTNISQNLTPIMPIENATTYLQSQDNNNKQLLDQISDNFLNYNIINDNNINNSNIYHQYDVVSLSQLSVASQPSLTTIPNHTNISSSNNNNNNNNQNYQYQQYSPLYKKHINNGGDDDGNSSICISEYNINERGQPPPYHIAKIFTKKSREDLLNYDTIRNHNEHIYNSDCIAIINSNNSTEILSNNKLPIEQHTMSIKDSFSNNIIPNYNLNNLTIDNNINDNNNSSNQNNDIILHNSNDKLGNDFNIITNLTDITSYKIDDQKLNNTNYIDDKLYLINNKNIAKVDKNININNDSINNKDDNNVIVNNDNKNQDYNIILNEYNDNNDDDDENKKKSLCSNKNGTNQWLFGLHKNPTVKQVIVKKEPSLGFEIKQDEHQGIFVSITLPNTSASSLLRINDKILDVDGFDFTKIPYDEAKKVLMECGPTLNIMISRK